MHTQMPRACWLARAVGVIAALCWAASCRGQACAVDGEACASNSNLREEWRLNLGGISRHASDTAASGHHWNEVNPGLGIELRRTGVPMTDAWDRWHMIATAGVLIDSRDYRSAYAGVASTYEFATLGRTRVDAGAGAFLFYRSRSWDGRRQWSPAVLPVLNLTDLRTGLGFEIVWRPPHTDGPATVYLQVTLRIGTTPARPTPTVRDSAADVFALREWNARRNIMISVDAPRPETRMLGGAPAPR